MGRYGVTYLHILIYTWQAYPHWTTAYLILATYHTKQDTKTKIRGKTENSLLVKVLISAVVLQGTAETILQPFIHPSSVLTTDCWPPSLLPDSADSHTVNFWPDVTCTCNNHIIPSIVVTMPTTALHTLPSAWPRLGLCSRSVPAWGEDTTSGSVTIR